MLNSYTPTEDQFQVRQCRLLRYRAANVAYLEMKQAPWLVTLISARVFESILYPPHMIWCNGKPISILSMMYLVTLSSSSSLSQISRVCERLITMRGLCTISPRIAHFDLLIAETFVILFIGLRVTLATKPSRVFFHAAVSVKAFVQMVLLESLFDECPQLCQACNPLAFFWP